MPEFESESEALRTVDFDGEGVRVVGMLDHDVSPTGFVIRRLPAWTRPQVMDIFTNTMTTMPSGVHIAFRTNSPTIELDVNATTLVIDGERGLTPAFDFEIGPGTGNGTGTGTANDGSAHIRRNAPGGTQVLVSGFPAAPTVEFVEGATDTLTVDVVPAENSGGYTYPMRDIKIWLSQLSVVEVRALRVGADATVEAPTNAPARWVHYGSSISHCMEADGPTGVWPVVAARKAGVELQSLAVAGCCHLDQYVARTIRDLDVQAISLKVGINIINGDTMRERAFGSALHGFLDTIREGHATTPLVVISPIMCPVAETRFGPTGRDDNGQCIVYDRIPELREGALTLARLRGIIEQIVAARVALGDTNLHYLHGFELFGADDVGDLPDGLHPNASGYRRMGDRFREYAFINDGPFAHLATNPGGPR